MVKQLRVVFEADTAGDLAVDREAEFKLCAPSVEWHRLQGEVIERQAMHRSVADIEHDLREWCAVGVAALTDLVHQTIEGDVLMREGVKGRLAYSQKQFAEGRIL